VGFLAVDVASAKSRVYSARHARGAGHETGELHVLDRGPGAVGSPPGGLVDGPAGSRAPREGLTQYTGEPRSVIRWTARVPDGWKSRR
jgi:hypothetical protein